MNQQLREKIKKVQALIKGGATQGERDAAKAALDRLMKSNNLTEKDLKGSETTISINNFEIKVESEDLKFEVNIMDLFGFFNTLVKESRNEIRQNKMNKKKRSPNRNKKK